MSVLLHSHVGAGVLVEAYALNGIFIQHWPIAKALELRLPVFIVYIGDIADSLVYGALANFYSFFQRSLLPLLIHLQLVKVTLEPLLETFFIHIR